MVQEGLLVSSLKCESYQLAQLVWYMKTLWNGLA